MEEIEASPVGQWRRWHGAKTAAPAPSLEDERDLRERALLRAVQLQVEEARRAAGLTKAALARTVGMHPASLRRLLTSPTANPTLRTLLAICDALGLEVTLNASPRRR